MYMDISIPTISETSPTQYCIEVNLKGKNSTSESGSTYVLRKRYSDFVGLVAALEKEIGAELPITLPAKKWIGKHDQAFLEERRRGLELFLRRLTKIDEFTTSDVLRSFLEISKHDMNVKTDPYKTDKNTTGKGAEDWASQLESVQSLLREARVSSGVEERKLRVTAQARLRLIDTMLSQYGPVDLGDGEYRRRKDIINDLVRQCDLYNNSASSNITDQDFIMNGPAGITNNGPSNSLFTTASANKRTSSRVLGVPKETDRTRQLDNRGVFQLQQEDMNEQESMLQVLRQTIQRQRAMGENIKEELDLQSDLLTELEGTVQSTGSKLKMARRQVNKFT
ncbi:Phox-like protein [Nadsonia fulvescens var. elongata DSM 6958]|uniref:Phox-like protein n=1 Tax=Nadsonia fulvescens var. elongata DSM 6958 TaxID=857566 RepID=A0A1E3PGG8_9ASCO|nr:Phox-like protein [Nadsonia fulvescens var. elongata DSM 6958]